MKEPRTVRSQINAMAKIMANRFGYEVPDDYDFLASENPRARGYWNTAVAIWEFLTGDSPDLDAEIED